MADTTFNPEIIREIWSKEVKVLYQEWLMADTLVRWVDGDFPDGDVLHIPTFAEMNVNSYTEGDEVVLDDANTGEFTLQIDKYYQSGFKITDKLKQDSYYMNQFVSHYTSMLFRALSEKKELEIFELQGEQTAANPNTIDGAAHRLGATGTGGAVTLADIAQAKYALSKSNVPRNMWRAVVDPSVTYQLTQIDNVIRQDKDFDVCDQWMHAA